MSNSGHGLRRHMCRQELYRIRQVLERTHLEALIIACNTGTTAPPIPLWV